jgi:hypothetical protein
LTFVVCNGWHRIDAARYKARYPHLKVVCPPGARDRVMQVVQVDATTDESPRPDPSDDSVWFESFRSRKAMEAAFMVRSSDGVSAVFGDTLFNLPHGQGLFWFVYGRLMGNTGGPRVTTIGRILLAVLGGRAELKAWMTRTAALPDLRRLVPGHGMVVTKDAGVVLAGVAGRL